MARRLLFLIFFGACSVPSAASADWIVSPYVGARFAGSTTFFVGREGAEENKFTFGSSVGLLTDGILGVEADVAFVPGFFESPAGVTQGSRVITLMGNVIVAAPLELAQYGLRPYVVGGAGLIHARATGAGELQFVHSDLFGMNLGGGALGPLTPRTSLRFDVRYFRNLSTDPAAVLASGEGLDLSFWRATVGLTFRF